MWNSCSNTSGVGARQRREQRGASAVGLGSSRAFSRPSAPIWYHERRAVAIVSEDPSPRPHSVSFLHSHPPLAVNSWKKSTPTLGNEKTASTPDPRASGETHSPGFTRGRISVRLTRCQVREVQLTNLAVVNTRHHGVFWPVCHAQSPVVVRRHKELQGRKKPVPLCVTSVYWISVDVYYLYEHVAIVEWATQQFKFGHGCCSPLFDGEVERPVRVTNYFKKREERTVNPITQNYRGICCVYDCVTLMYVYVYICVHINTQIY